MRLTLHRGTLLTDMPFLGARDRAALAARPGARRGLSTSRAELGKQAVSDMVLDGEIVAFDASGKPSFGAMQDRGGGPSGRCSIASTSCSFAGVDLRRRDLCRSPALPFAVPAAVAAGAAGARHRRTASLCTRRRWRAASKASIGKRKDSKYEAGRRSGSWVKVKATNSADFVVGGYTQGKGRARGARRAAPRLLGGRQAALRLARRLRLRRQDARAGPGAARAAAFRASLHSRRSPPT